MTVTQASLDAARASGAASVGTIDVNNLGGGSLQLMFAKLQLTLAESAKSSAMNYMQDIQKTQEEQKLVAKLLQEARQSQANAGTSWNAMSTEMVQYMDAHKLAYDTTGNDHSHRKDEWEVAIKSLQARSEALGTDTQQKMVFVQDFMGQYNSYLQGSNSVIQQSNQTLAELARAR
jgi:pantothenate kinase-related protein Tda10